MNIELLKESVSECKKCKLCETRTNIVFGTGNINSKIVFVGEAPGESEDKTGIPFVGRAGKLLDKYLYAVNISRDDIYICNILKCRPPQNRDPEPLEEEMCIGYLRDQIKIINPEYIVCLGRISASKLIHEDFKITKEHGIWFQKKQFKMMAVYHPSFLLRASLKFKEEMLADFHKIEEKYKLFK